MEAHKDAEHSGSSEAQEGLWNGVKENPSSKRFHKVPFLAGFVERKALASHELLFALTTFVFWGSRKARVPR